MMVLDQKFCPGETHKPGYTGLLSRRGDFISNGIDWFERWDLLPGSVPVSHAFIITGPDSTVEAFSDGVKEGTLSAYLADPNCAVLVRAPLNWTPDLGTRISKAAMGHLGDTYNYGAIVMLAAENSFVGRLLDHMTGGRFGHAITQLAVRKHEEICSQVVGLAMAAQAEFGNDTLFAPSVLGNLTPQRIEDDAESYAPGCVRLLPVP